MNRISSFNRDDLGLARVIIFAALLVFSHRSLPLHYLVFNLPLQCGSSMPAWIGLPFSKGFVIFLARVYQAALVFSLLGLFARASLWLSFFTFFILNLWALQFCYYNHTSLPIVTILLFWALLDQSSSFRIDSLIFKSPSTTTLIPGFLIWALRAFFCTVFFVAGLTKLRSVGSDWFTSDSLQKILLMQNYYFEHSPARTQFAEWNSWLIQMPTLTKAIALIALALELSAPLALWSKNCARIIVSLLFLMQVSTYILLYIDFRTWIVIYLVWLNYPMFMSLIRRFLSQLRLKKI